MSDRPQDRESDAVEIHDLVQDLNDLQPDAGRDTIVPHLPSD